MKRLELFFYKLNLPRYMEKMSAKSELTTMRAKTLNTMSVESSEFFLATESLSQRVTVVPSGNAPTRVSPSLTLSPKKNSLVESNNSGLRQSKASKAQKARKRRSNGEEMRALRIRRKNPRQGLRAKGRRTRPPRDDVCTRSSLLGQLAGSHTCWAALNIRNSLISFL
jgi:hypothetical protein